MIGNPIIWKGNTPLLAEELLGFLGHPTVHLSLLPIQPVGKMFTKGHVKYVKWT